MARRLKVVLNPEQRAELQHLRGHDPRPYVRERAAAILQVASGKTLGEVASRGLRKTREIETVSSWVKRYLAEGVSGLEIRDGRGRKSGNRYLRADPAPTLRRSNRPENKGSSSAQLSDEEPG